MLTVNHQPHNLLQSPSCLLECDRDEKLLKLAYTDVTNWAGCLLLIIYRAFHTAVWGEEPEGIV